MKYLYSTVNNSKNLNRNHKVQESASSSRYEQMLNRWPTNARDPKKTLPAQCMKSLISFTKNMAPIYGAACIKRTISLEIWFIATSTVETIRFMYSCVKQNVYSQKESYPITIQLYCLQNWLPCFNAYNIMIISAVSKRHWAWFSMAISCTYAQTDT